MKTSLFLIWFICLRSFAQLPEAAVESPDPGSLFRDTTALSLSLITSIKEIRKEANETVFAPGMLYYQIGGRGLDSIAVGVQRRGNFRREHCHYLPLKFRLDSTLSAGTIFEGNAEVKLVFPCTPGSNDYLAREYVAYKLFEKISPYHYKTRFANIELNDQRSRRIRSQSVPGFLLEDHGTLKKRLNAKRIRRNLPAPMQDPRATARNNLFQFLIGNTDFSIRLQHNQRLYYISGRYISIPYDFDTAGLVNPPYAAVSNTQTLDASISDVTQRIYKGFQRDEALMQEIRAELLAREEEMLQTVQQTKPLFKNPEQFRTMLAYLQESFDILRSDSQFQRQILARMRD